MNLEDVKLREMSQREKDTYCLTSFICRILDKFIESERKRVVTRGCRAQGDDGQRAWGFVCAET